MSRRDGFLRRRISRRRTGVACKTYLCHDDGECGEAAKTGCGTVKEDCDVYGPSAITSARSLDRDKGEQQTSRTSPPPSLLPTHSSGLYRSLLPLDLCEPVFTNSLCRTRRQHHSEQPPRHSNDLHHNTPSLQRPPGPTPSPSLTATSALPMITRTMSPPA